MHRLPGIAIIRRSYALLFDEFGTIVRISWFPLLFVAISQYLIERASVQNVITAVETMDPFLLTQFQILPLLGGLVDIVAVSIVAVAIHRLILFGDRRPGTFIYFAFGRVEVLFIAFPLIVFVAAILMAIPLSYIAYQSDPTNPMVYVATVAIPVLVILFFSIRLSPILPIAVVEERFDLRQAWDLTRDNFWRLFGTFLLGGLPFAIVLVAIGFVIAWLSGTTALMTAASPEEVLTALRRWTDLLPVTAAITYVVLIFGGAFSVALLSYSYKALKGYGPDDLVTP